jgi:hypothetical protein
MGYFNVVTNGYFKTAQDGRKLFLPWGVLGRGYIIASEQDYLRLRQQIKIYTVVMLVLVIGSVSLQGKLGGFVIATLLTGFYLVWTRYLLRGLQRSDERMSLQESIASQARAFSPLVLWLLEILALAFVGGGIFIFIVDPGNWLIALVSIVLFGLVAVKGASMIVLRRRATVSGSNPN